jgi:alpha-beta hydrolase superfamily lysophospholipase
MRIKLYLLIIFILLFILPLFSIDFTKFIENVKNIPDKIFYYKSLDGTKLAYRVISPEKPKAVLIFIHGISVYGKYYIPFAKMLAENGIKVYLPDLRGHGNSEGKRGDSPHTYALVLDFGVFYQLIILEITDIPIYLGGHSMGASLTLKYVKELSLSPSGLILIAGGLPIERISPKSNKVLKIKTLSKIFQFLTNIFPHFRIISWDLPKEIKDPLLVNNYSLSFFQSAFPYDIKNIWTNINLPTFVIIGEKDEFYEKEDLEKIFEKYKKENIKFILLPDANHFDILEKSINYIIEWILGG